MSGALRRRPARMTAVRTPRIAPCQTNWTRAHPSACAIGWRARISITLIVLLPVCGAGRLLSPIPIGVLRLVEQPANLGQILVARAPRRECLHHELRRGPAERAVQQIT